MLNHKRSRLFLCTHRYWLLWACDRGTPAYGMCSRLLKPEKNPFWTSKQILHKKIKVFHPLQIWKDTRQRSNLICRKIRFYSLQVWNSLSYRQEIIYIWYYVLTSSLLISQRSTEGGWDGSEVQFSSRRSPTCDDHGDDQTIYILWWSVCHEKWALF